MKVAIGLPSREQMHAATALDLASMVGRFASQGIADLALFNATGTLIVDQRAKLAVRALQTGADWLLWVDSDMRFPPESLEALMAHDLPIVGVNYVTKEHPCSPVAGRINDKKEWKKVPTLETSEGLEEVTATGFGLMLIKTDVLRKMRPPWFQIGYIQQSMRLLGEDVHFCMHAKEEAGALTMIDHDLSKRVGHIGQYMYTWRDAVGYEEPQFVPDEQIARNMEAIMAPKVVTGERHPTGRLMPEAAD